jgi:hypothetical protein
LLLLLLQKKKTIENREEVSLTGSKKTVDPKDQRSSLPGEIENTGEHTNKKNELNKIERMGLTIYMYTCIVVYSAWSCFWCIAGSPF